MKCPECKRQNPEDANFCNECGSKLKPTCPQCGKLNPLGSKFCNECGLNLANQFYPDLSSRSLQQPTSSSTPPEPAALPEGERRQATIVFSDLSGYTSLNERLDPEEVEAFMSQIKDEAVRIVESHEGIVNQFIGDEVVAIFGIPTAHEDDAVQAIKAAKKIHEVVCQISLQVEKETGAQLRMHTGISTGLVVTHSRDVRDGSYGMTGDAVNIGARLVSSAKINEILVCPETKNLMVPFFDVKALDAIRVRGKTLPIIPYQVKGQSAIQTRFEAAENKGFTHFTGRKSELMMLHSCFENMQEGKGQFVTVVGEAGLGKSRLVYEFRHSLDRSEITVLQGRCQSYGKSIPYFPHINALRRGLNLHEDDTLSELHVKIVSNVLKIDPSLEQYLPIYLHLLSVPSNEYPLPKQLRGQELIDAIHETLSAIIILNSKRQPYVSILEDWHWVDEASNAALKHIISVIPSHKVMLIVIYRPDYKKYWGNWSHHTSVTLNRLDLQSCEEITKSIWNVDHIPEGIAPLVHERTDGNPFFIEEICNALFKDGKIRTENRHAVMTQSLENLSLPNSVQAVIRARLDRLNQYNHEVLRLASVIGREFSHRILEQITTFKEQLSEAIDDLKVSELIQQIRVIPESEYMFKHVITQEVTYETILLKRRKELHGLVGRAIEELYQNRIEEQVNLLYRHFSRAENWTKAAEYGGKAAKRAYRLGQFKESVSMFDNAKLCLKKLSKTRTNQEKLIDMELEMIWPLQFLGQQDRALGICKEAESVADVLNDPMRRGKIDFAYGLLYFFENQYDWAEMYYLKILQNPVKVELKELIETVKFPLAVTYFSTGSWKNAADLYSEVILNREQAGTEGEYSEELPFLPFTHSCHHLAYIRALQGHIKEAKKLIQKGHTPDFKNISNLQSQAYCTLWHSAFSVLIGEDFDVYERVSEVLDFAKKTDSPILLFLLYAAKGNACMANQDIESAMTAYKSSMSMIAGTAHRRYLDEVYHNFIEVLLELGDFSSAKKYFEEAQDLIPLNPKINTARFDYLKARLISSSNSPDYDQAEKLFKRSFKADEESGAVVLAARKRYYFGCMLKQKGEIDRSQMIMAKISPLFENWGIPIWKQKCLQELEALRLT